MNAPGSHFSAPPPIPNGDGPANPSAQAFLWTEQLTLRYGDKTALEGVSLSVIRGRITALIGPSGCGKTSFLNCLNRLVDLIPSCRLTGRVRIEGLDVFDPKTDVLTLRRRVGMIFQKPNPFPFSIRRNLEFPLREHGVRDRHQLEEKVETALHDVGLWDEVKDRLNRPAMSLSGGQQQRLCLARALVLGPEALLLDEPCSALDPISSGVIEDLIARLRNQLTLVVVTHNLAQARRIADYSALFWVQDGAGKLVEYGPTQQMFEAPREMVTADYVTGIRG
jgi:phosphate transport system ATP-binding protein